MCLFMISAKSWDQTLLEAHTENLPVPAQKGEVSLGTQVL